MAKGAKSKPRARKAVATKTKKAVATKASKPRGVDESGLTKGQVRKLTALRKSLGDKIANKAFADWLMASGAGGGVQAGQVDKNAQLIAETLSALALAGKLRVPRGGYALTRGRGRVIVTKAKS